MTEAEILEAREYVRKSSPLSTAEVEQVKKRWVGTSEQWEAILSPKAPLVDTNDRMEVAWLWPDRFPRGKIVILDGDPGLSKSMFSLSVAVSIMTGKPLLDGTKPEATGGVLLLSAEDDLRDTINPRLVAAGAPDGPIPMLYQPSTKANGEAFSLADAGDRRLMEKMIAQIDVKLVIIDPLNAYLGDKIDSHNDQKIRQVLGPLSEIANRTGVVMLCLRHLSKAGGGKAIYRGMGSIGYTAAARANFFMAKHPDDPGTFVFAASKFNLGPAPPSLQYKLAFAKVPGISREVPFVSCGAPCELSANDLAAAQDKDAVGCKKEDAVEFLRMFLSDSDRTAKEIENKAAKEKISYATLRRAKDKLKVKAVKDGKSWYWHLPEKERVKEPF